MEEASCTSRARGSASHSLMASGGVSSLDSDSCAEVLGGVALAPGSTPAMLPRARAASMACRLRAACQPSWTQPELANVMPD